MGTNFKFAGNPLVTDKSAHNGRISIITEDIATFDITSKSVMSNLLYDLKTLLRIANAYWAEAADEIIKEKDIEED